MLAPYNTHIVRSPLTLLLQEIEVESLTASCLKSFSLLTEDHKVLYKMNDINSFSTALPTNVQKEAGICCHLIQGSQSCRALIAA